MNYFCTPFATCSRSLCAHWLRRNPADAHCLPCQIMLHSASAGAEYAALFHNMPCWHLSDVSALVISKIADWHLCSLLDRLQWSSAHLCATHILRKALWIHHLASPLSSLFAGAGPWADVPHYCTLLRSSIIHWTPDIKSRHHLHLLDIICWNCLSISVQKRLHITGHLPMNWRHSYIALMIAETTYCLYCLSKALALW